MRGAGRTGIPMGALSSHRTLRILQAAVLREQYETSWQDDRQLRLDVSRLRRRYLRVSSTKGAPRGTPQESHRETLGWSSVPANREISFSGEDESESARKLVAAIRFVRDWAVAAGDRLVLKLIDAFRRIRDPRSRDAILEIVETVSMAFADGRN